MGAPHASFKILRYAEWCSAVFAVLVAVLIVFGHHRHDKEVAEQAREQNRLKMAVTREHIEEYIDLIRMDLRMIALDDEVIAMTRDSHDYIKAIYEEHYDKHRLSEIHVIERDFDGTRPPLMAFEHGAEEHDVDELYSLEQEADEHRTQIAHIGRFARDPALEVLISRPVPLCVNKPGVVVSVPVRSNGELVGIVAGMVPSENISKVLERGNYENMVILASDRGDFFGCLDLPEETRRWFEDRRHERDVTGFSKTREETFAVGEYVSLWTVADIPGEQEWHMAFMYDEATYLTMGGALGVIVGWGSAGIVLLLGGAVVLLCRSFRRRFRAEDEVRQASRMLETEIARTGAILETATDSIITIDARGIIESFNAAAEKTFRYTADEVIGRNVSMLAVEPHQEKHDEYLQHYLQTGQSKIIGVGREVVGLRKDGSIFPMDLSVSEARHGSRRVFCGIVRDITERKRIENTLRGAKACAEHAAHKLEEKVNELQEFNRLAVGRELRMIELKQEVNELAQQLGVPHPHDLSFENAENGTRHS